MQKLRYRYRLYPTPGQRICLAQAFGCARVVWNDALALVRDLYNVGRRYPGGTELQKRCITQAKRSPTRAWLSGVSNILLQQSVRDLDQAFRNWWKSKGKARAPRFKSKSNGQSIRLTRGGFQVEERTLKICKVGSIPIRWSRDLPSPPSSCTIIKDCAGRYFVSFVVELEPETLPPNGKAVGVDLGLASLAVLSDGEKIAPPKVLRSALKRLRRLQRSLSRRVKGSRNRGKARLLVAKCHAKVADKRLDVLHKLSTRLIRENQVVCIEDLNVSGLLKNHKLARSIADAGWRMFRTLLESKAELCGRTVRVVSRWFPSSQICCHCGHGHGKKPLGVRTWKCSVCGAEQDRDVNAAKNLEKEAAAGLAEALNACGAERQSGVPVAGDEAGTRLNRARQKCLV